MNDESIKLLAINPLRPQLIPYIDIQPVFIQYWFALLIIVMANLFILHQLCLQVWKIYQQTDLQNIVHDIYDKNILCLSIKYVFINVICILYFHDITNPPIQIIKLFWIYCLTVVFMKFILKQILWPAISLFAFLTIIAVLGISIWQIFPVFKLLLIQCVIIIYVGTTQTLKINKIINSYQKSKHSQFSIESLLQKDRRKRNKNEYDQFTMGLQLDQQMIGHIQNRRSFCIVFLIILCINIILYANLQAGKELLGQVFLSLILHSLPLYVVFWYLRKSVQQKQYQNELQKSSIHSKFNQMASQRTSKIVIQMVDLKK